MRECHQRSWQVADCPTAELPWRYCQLARVTLAKGAVKTGASEFRGAPARVVFADDDAVLRQLLRGLLGFLPHVTVVGEAADGIEAVQLVAQHYPDTVLLDIGMPRLDGFGAAEVIRSFRPRTRLMLHTAEPNAEKQQRAKALGLPLLDKLQLNTTTDLVEQYAVSDEHPLATDIEPLVLLALAGRADSGVLVVKADESVPFYNPAFAAVVDLPFPPESVTLSDLRASGYSGSAPMARRTHSTSSHSHGPSPVASLSRTWSISATRMARYGRLR